MKAFRTTIIANSVKLLQVAVTLLGFVFALNASVISNATTSCIDETTGLNLGIGGNCFGGAEADATVSGVGTTELVILLNTGAGGGPIIGDQLQFSAEADATVVVYTPGPIRPGFLTIDYNWNFENNSAGGFGGSIAIDGLLPQGRSGGLNIPYEIGTPFTLRSTANAQAYCIPSGFCGVGAFSSTAKIFAHYVVPDDPDQQFVVVPILDYSTTSTPEPRSAVVIIMLVAISLRKNSAIRSARKRTENR